MHHFPSALYPSQIVEDEIAQLIGNQKDLEEQYVSVLSKKNQLGKTTKNAQRLGDMNKQLAATGGDLRNSTHILGRGLRQNPLTGDNMAKVQQDR